MEGGTHMNSFTEQVLYTLGSHKTNSPGVVIVVVVPCHEDPKFPVLLEPGEGTVHVAVAGETARGTVRPDLCPSALAR